MSRGVKTGLMRRCGHMAVTQTQAPAGTAQRILDVAERLVQSRGYNGFSYADIAGELGITKASLHYHFASKAELGEALIERYSARFTKRSKRSTARLRRRRKARRLCRALRRCPARRPHVPVRDARSRIPDPAPPMRGAVIRFFDHNLAWLASVLADGRAEGTLSFGGSPADAAQTVLGALQGAMLVARPYGDVARFEAAARHTLAALGSTPVA